MKIRKASVEDAAGFVRIKDSLPMPETTAETNQGGFLLGTSEEVYAFYIENGYCAVAEKDGHLVGFGIILPDFLIKASELWQKRALAEWSVPVSTFENKKICYFEQLAFLPKFRRMAPVLAYALLHETFQGTDHEMMFTTTVKKPVANLAAVPFITSAGGVLIGNINEYYAGVGEINSDIYLVEKDNFLSAVQGLNISSVSTGQLFDF